MRHAAAHGTFVSTLALVLGALAIGAGVAAAQFTSAATASPTVTTLTLGNPGSASATPGTACGSVTIDWTAATKANSYRVQVKEGAGPWTDLFVETANVTRVTDTTGHLATSVSYRVHSRHASSDWEGSTPAVSNTLTC